MKIRRWELTTVEDGAKDTSHHCTEANALYALIKRPRIKAFLDDHGEQETYMADNGVIIDEDELRQILSDYYGIDYWIESETLDLVGIDINEWEVVK